MTKDCEQVLFVTFAKEGVYQLQCSGLVPGPGHVCCTLIVGEEKCLLIDNGIGDDDFGDFPPELVPLMQGKELLCAATHGHPDHMGGAKWFETVYMMPQDFHMLKGVFGAEYDESAQTIAGRTKILPLEDGQVFDLGGRSVKTIAAPGHTWGSCCFYDDKARIMMTGDALNRHVMYQCEMPPVSLRVCAQALEDLLAYQFDLFLGGHHGEPFPREFVHRMVAHIRAFRIEDAEPYKREGMPENIRNFHVGRGYGDPNYVSIIINADYLEDYLA